MSRFHAGGYIIEPRKQIAKVINTTGIAFTVHDLRRTAILLIGGNKTGDNRWYEKYIPAANKLYKQHIKTLKKEGLIDE